MNLIKKCWNCPHFPNKRADIGGSPHKRWCLANELTASKVWFAAEVKSENKKLWLILFVVFTRKISTILTYLSDWTRTLQIRYNNFITFIVNCSVPLGSVLGLVKFQVYTEYRSAVLEQHHVDHDLYADHIHLRSSVILVQHWYNHEYWEMRYEYKRCASNSLQLNLTKSEIISFATIMSLRCLQGLNLILHIGMDTMTISNVVLNLGIPERDLTMKKHIGKITTFAFCSQECLLIL